MILVKISAKEQNGRFEVGGQGILPKEEFLLAGALPRVEALIRGAPQLSECIAIKVDGASVTIRPDSEFVNNEKIEILRARLLSVVRQMWDQILKL